MDNFAYQTGKIWSIVFGLCMGSYATSVSARLPRRLPFKKSNPHCASCKKLLEPRDLLPIFSYIFNRGHCRFCSSKIPFSIFITETLVTIIFVVAFVRYDFCDNYILLTTFYSCQVMLLVMWIKDRFFSVTVFYISLLVAVTFQILHHPDIYDVIYNGLFGEVIGALILVLSNQFKGVKSSLLASFERPFSAYISLLFIWFKIII